MRLRRMATGLALAGAGVLIGRALVPRLHRRMLAGCEHMVERMPDDFPPKRMMRGIDEIRATTTRTLELLQEREMSHVA